LFRNIKFSSKQLGKLLELTSGDWGLWIHILLHGKAKFINNKTAVYRMNIGVSQNSNWEANYLKRASYLISIISSANSLNDKKIF